MGVNAELRTPALAHFEYLLGVGRDLGSGPTRSRIGRDAYYGLSLRQGPLALEGGKSAD
jgi:hypothetical protein